MKSFLLIGQSNMAGRGDFAKEYNGGMLKYLDIVNDQLKAMPQRLENCRLASAEGLSHRGDQIHFSFASYRIL